MIIGQYKIDKSSPVFIIAELSANHNGSLDIAIVKGGFPPALSDALRRDPQLVALIAQRIADAHFPESIRNDVLAAAGFPSDLSTTTPAGEAARRRDPAFREKVLLAYQYRCGVCGHDLRLGSQTIGLEAAHIKWFQAQGPDIVPNGLALCSLHHKIFDLGAFAILPETYQMVFSQHLNASDETARRTLAYHGAGLILPQSNGKVDATFYAKQANGINDNEKVVLTNQVVAKKMLDQGQMQFETAELTAFPQTRELESQHQVVVTAPQAEFVSQGLKANLNTGQYDFFHIRGKYEP